MLFEIGYSGIFIILAVLAGLWVLSGSDTLPVGDLAQYKASRISVIAFVPFVIMTIFALKAGVLKELPGLMATASSTMLAVALLVSPLSGKDFNAMMHNNSSLCIKLSRQSLNQKTR